MKTNYNEPNKYVTAFYKTLWVIIKVLLVLALIVAGLAFRLWWDKTYYHWLMNL